MWDDKEPDEGIKRLLAAREAGDLDALLAALESDPAHAHVAARLLAHAGDRRAVPLLVDLLDSKRGAARLGAVKALGELGAPLRARDRLVEIALGDPLPSAREWACSTIAGYGDPDAAQLLLGLLADRHRQVRLGAARALASMGDPDFAEPIALAAPRLLREPGRWLLDRKAWRRAVRAAAAAPREHSSPQPER